MKSYYIMGGAGARLNVEEYGNQHGRPLLFIHGFTQSQLCWKHQIESILSKSFRIITFDLRGHGMSDKPIGGYNSSQNWADDVQGIIEELNLYDPILVGWSFGGLVICDYLRIYGEKYISGINFVGAATMMGCKQAYEFLTPERQNLNTGLMSEFTEESIDGLTKFIKLCFCKEPLREDLYFILGYNSIVPPFVRQEILGRKIINDDVLQKIKKPVLITHGEEDKVIKPESSNHISKLVHHAKISLYASTGHSPFWESTQRFNRELKKFAGEI
jgi:non-heme chloroperoxidase